MSPADDRPDDTPGTSGDAARLAALERQVATLAAEVAQLRATTRQVSAVHPSALARAAHVAHVALEGDRVESIVGRYGTLLLAAFVILMGVGVLVKVAIVRGLLTPEVRVGIGALVAVGVGGAGLWFHRRGDVRYGNVLLAITLAIVDLVAWAAGPRFHLVPDGAALVVVDLVAVGLVTLALLDASEFLFGIAVAGALSSPFVTSEGGSAPALLAYGAVVLLGALRAVHDPKWWRAIGVLVAGSLVYSFAAARMSLGPEWYAPFVIPIFGGVCALGALLLGDSGWRGRVACAFLAAVLIGVPIGWDRIGTSPMPATLVVAFGLAAITHAALWSRAEREPAWTAAALVLPLLSLGVMLAWAQTAPLRAIVLGVWTVFALTAWHAERRRGAAYASGVHLLAAGLLGTSAVVEWLWSSPLPLVGGLAVWGVVMARASRDERTPVPLIGVAVPLLLAALSSIDQLASRQAYAYVPFLTRSSGSALLAALGIAAAGRVLAGGSGELARWADPSVRLGGLAAFLIVWGRMEMAEAFSPDLSAFLLIAYYAACGLGSIIFGRLVGIRRLRLAGLALASYAAVKAVAHASEIGGILLRVGAYGAVGLFLLGAGYLYRERVTAAMVGDSRST